MYKKKRFFSDKNIIIMSVVSIMAVSALAAGMIFSNQNNSDKDISIVELEDDTTKEAIPKEQNVNADVEKESTTQSNKETKTDELSQSAIDVKNNTTQETQTEHQTTSKNQETTEKQTTQDSAEAALNPASVLSFDKNSTLIWPVETNDIIIEFSMDKTTYFSTLDMYKTSDAVCIRSDLDSPVFASFKSVVKTIGYNEEIGHFITLDLGNDYELTYGQLKDIQLTEGSTLKAGDLIGYISEPTKYYSVEGPNLYLKMTENGTPIDPLDFLNY